MKADSQGIRLAFSRFGPPLGAATMGRTAMRVSGISIALCLLGGLQAAHAEDLLMITPPAAQSPSPTPDSEEQDRKKAQQLAVTLGMVAAGIQAGACAMLMKAALETPPGPERDEKMAQALQQCGQAAATAANAAQNKAGEKKNSQASSGSVPLLVQSNNAKSEPSREGEPRGVTEAPAANSETASPEEEIKAAQTTAAPEVAPEAAPVQMAKDAGIELPSNESIVPERIPRTKLGYDETGKSGADSPSPSPGSFAKDRGAGESKSLDLETKVAENEEHFPENRTQPESGERQKGEEEGTEGVVASEGAGGSEKPTEGNNPIDSLLALLGTKSGDGGLGLPPSDIVSLGGSADEEGAPNIFEYATYRYRILARHQIVRKKSKGSEDMTVSWAEEAR